MAIITKLRFIPLICLIAFGFAYFFAPYIKNADAATTYNCGGRKFYIDYSAGNDSNSGTKTSPWKRAPGMVGFTGNYAHVAKDCFYFKGGVSWPNNVFPLTTTGGGDATANDYYGTDKTWYAGSSFTKPIWDGQNSPITGTKKSFFVSSDDYNTLHDIEMTNYYARNCSFGGCAMVYWVGVSKQIADDIYVHNFNVRDEVSDTNAIIFQSATYQRDDNSLINSKIEGDPQSYMEVSRAVNTVKNNVMHDVIGMVFPNGTGEISSNLMYNCGYPSFPAGGKSHHADVIQVNPPNYSSTPEQTFLIHDNVIYDTGVEDANGNECETMLIGNPGENYFIWNNIIYSSHGNEIGLLQDSSSGGPAKSINIFNNTIVGGRDFSGPCIRSGAGTQTIKIQNNHCITDSSFLYEVSAANLVVQNNLTQTVAQATSSGFTPNSTNAYSPSSANASTIGAGANLTSLCSGGLSGLCSSTNYAGTLSQAQRPTTGAWDIGAYQYSNPGNSQKTGDLNSDGKVDIVDLSTLLTNYGKSGMGDINNSGLVDIFDLSILLSNYGK